MTQEAKKEEVGYMINYSTDLGNGNGLSLTGNLPKSATLTDMNTEFDKIRAAFSRQQAKSACIGLEQEVDRLAAQKKTVIDTINRLDNKHDNKGGASAAERQQRDSALLNLEQLSTNIESKQKLLQKLADESK